MHNWTQSRPARPQGGREGGLSWGRLPGGVTEAVSPGDSRQASPTARHRLSWPLWGPLGRGVALTVGREPTATGAGRSDAAPWADPADNSVRGSTDPEAEATSPPGALRHQRHREGRRRLPASPLPGWALPGGCPVCHLPTAAPPGHFLNLRAPGVGRCREKPQALWEGTAGRLLAGAWPWAAASDPGAGPRGERAGLWAAPGQGATVAATGTQGQQEPPLPGEGREKSDRPAAERRTLLTVSGGQRRAGVSMQGAGVAQGGTPTKSGGVGGHQQSWKVTHFSAGHHTSCFTGDGSQRPSVPGHPRDAQAAGTGPHAQQRGAGFLGSWICRLGGRGSHTVRSESVGKEV